MVDIEKAKKEFDNYVKDYDFNQYRIKSKYNHSYRVMENAKNIATSLNLEDDQIELATLIGLLHDIARFKQWEEFKTFHDRESFDHGDVGAKILSKDNYIRNYIETDKYDDVIKTAIFNHNKYKIDESIKDETTLIHSKIIRDADKLDIYLEAANQFWMDEQERKEIEESYITDSYYNQVKARKQIFRDEKPTKLGPVIEIISFAFDLNTNYAKKVLLEKGYIDIIINKFNFKDAKTKERINELKEVVKEFLAESK